MADKIKFRPVTDQEIQKYRDVLWFISATSIEDSVRYWPVRAGDEPGIITSEDSTE